MTKGLDKNDAHTWMEVAQTIGEVEAQIIAGLLNTAEIPTYIENGSGLSASAFGTMILPGRIYVPQEYYEAALDLLDENEDLFPPALDEPGIKFD